MTEQLHKVVLHLTGQCTWQQFWGACEFTSMIIKIANGHGGYHEIYPSFLPRGITLF
uniref:Uncharacterized protein n=1 Tax=Setaria viridis TaxID=4556 RepID=A0A4U6VD74_SETVI|nr:hypothetical protein SEVIR_3G175000v2 [Setaria viridis]